MTLPALSFRNVWVEYGDNVVLEKLSLDIARGAFVSIVGPPSCAWPWDRRSRRGAKSCWMASRSRPSPVRTGVSSSSDIRSFRT